jgi:hypothetical protein
MASLSTMRWKVEATNPSKLSREQWWASSALGVVLIVMAATQLITFGDFRDTLQNMGLSSPTTWAVLVIAAELWGAANLFKLRLSHLFRLFSVAGAVAVASFWFVESLQIVANNTVAATSNGFFGGWLNQTPGWWTVIEASVLLFWVLYAVSLTMPAMAKRR